MWAFILIVIGIGTGYYAVAVVEVTWLKVLLISLSILVTVMGIVIDRERSKRTPP